MMEETTVPTDESYDYDSDDHLYDRPAERWAPLGANASPAPSVTETSHFTEAEQLRRLEEEQEELNNSLFALTTHFAQVQFRLKQIVSADPEEKEKLLKELEEFAFKGIPDARAVKLDIDKTEQEENDLDDHEHDQKIREQREKQQELIMQLKDQLEELEKYAYESGTADDLPTSIQMEKQKVIIDELKNKLELELDDFAKLSPEQLRDVVNDAIAQIVNPAKVKEKLVDQLRTQVSDLERFISFLQGDAESPGPLGQTRCTCHCPAHGPNKLSSDEHSDISMQQECCIPDHRYRIKDKSEKDQNATAMTAMKRALTVLQIFVITQFGCGSREFRKNTLKKTMKANHYGDLRARVEVAIEKVLELAKTQENYEVPDSDYTSDTEESFTVQCNQALTMAVRKSLALALRDLLQHGLVEMSQSRSLVSPIGCFPVRSQAVPKTMHPWELFIKYYEMKHGREYNDTPVRKLSESFHLNMVGSKAVTAKQTLLGAIHNILTSHRPLKRSNDAMFKAFICRALNEKRIVTWFRLVFKTTPLIDHFYQPWSYVVKTNFEDTFASLQRLKDIEFHLPVDLAVRPFTNIKDAF